MWCTSFGRIEAATPEIIDSLRYCFDWSSEKSLLRPQAYHMAQWFQFCMNNWIWKSYRQDGCRVCSLWTISATVWRFQNNIWLFQHNPDEFLRRFISVDETNSLLHTRDEGTVKTMNFTKWIRSEEGKDRKIGRKDDGHSLGCTQYNSYWLPSIEAND